MSVLNVRHGVINEVYNALNALLYDPPVSSQRSVSYPPKTDLDVVRARLEEVTPYWEVYLNAVKKGHAYQNMQEDERSKYVKCIWWMEMLRGVALPQAKEG